VDTDPLFQQALASAMNSGKQAMQDTIGQASALTGGYGSSYATTAGNQAYNAFIEDAYDNLPQYYEMALQAYQMEGEEMYRQFGMVSELDDKEFNRNLTAYDVTSQHRNRIYDEAYNTHRDSVNDAFAMANLQLNEHGQRVSDAYNYYSASSDYADKVYEREYTEWADSINMAWKEIEALNTEAWANKNFDEGVRQYEGNQAFQAEENQKQRDWQSAEAEKERAFTASENAKSRAASRSGGGGGGSSTSKTKAPSQSQMKGALEAYNEGGTKGLETYLASFTYADDEFLTTLANYATSYGHEWMSDYESMSGATISNDTKNGTEKNGWFGTTLFGSKGVDHDDEYTYTNAYGEKTTATYDDIEKIIKNSTMPQDKKDELLKNIKGQSKR
jgi:hypothetical protein